MLSVAAAAGACCLVLLSLVVTCTRQSEVDSDENVKLQNVDDLEVRKLAPHMQSFYMKTISMGYDKSYSKQEMCGKA